MKTREMSAGGKQNRLPLRTRDKKKEKKKKKRLTLWSKSPLQIAPLPPQSRLRSPTKTPRHPLLERSLHGINHEPPDRGDVAKAVAGAADRQHQARVLRVLADKKSAVRGVGTPTDAGVREGPCGQVRHCFLQEEADAGFRFLGDLVAGKGDALLLGAFCVVRYQRDTCKAKMMVRDGSKRTVAQGN